MVDPSQIKDKPFSERARTLIGDTVSAIIAVMSSISCFICSAHMLADSGSFNLQISNLAWVWGMLATISVLVTVLCIMIIFTKKEF